MFYSTSLLADLKGRRRFVPPLKSSAGSASGNRNGSGAVSSSSIADTEAPCYASEKKVCYVLA